MSIFFCIISCYFYACFLTLHYFQSHMLPCPHCSVPSDQNRRQRLHHLQAADQDGTLALGPGLRPDRLQRGEAGLHHRPAESPHVSVTLLPSHFTPAFSRDHNMWKHEVQFNSKFCFVRNAADEKKLHLQPNKTETFLVNYHSFEDNFGSSCEGFTRKYPCFTS